MSKFDKLKDISYTRWNLLIDGYSVKKAPIPGNWITTKTVEESIIKLNYSSVIPSCISLGYEINQMENGIDFIHSFWSGYYAFSRNREELLNIRWIIFNDNFLRFKEMKNLLDKYKESFTFLEK